ncbi:MAG: hypothetical protein ACOZQL_14800 [Myxococcota bacterium]
METLSTPESIVIDGANGVRRDAREHFPHGAAALGVGVVVVVAAAVLWRRLPRWAMAVALGVAALPGLAHVLVLRADAPASRPALATTIASTLEDLQRQAPWPRVKLVREDDDVLFPLTRYAVPGRAPPVGEAIELETRGARLGVPCRSEGARVVCGAGP